MKSGSKIRSIQMVPDKWYTLDSPEITECCDCSLVHVTEYKIWKGRLLWRARLDEAATRAKRKERGLRIIEVKDGSK